MGPKNELLAHVISHFPWISLQWVQFACVGILCGTACLTCPVSNEAPDIRILVFVTKESIPVVCSNSSVSNSDVISKGSIISAISTRVSIENASFHLQYIN